jgi:hypothetical protein
MTSIIISSKKNKDNDNLNKELLINNDNIKCIQNKNNTSYVNLNKIIINDIYDLNLTLFKPKNKNKYTYSNSKCRGQIKNISILNNKVKDYFNEICVHIYNLEKVEILTIKTLQNMINYFTTNHCYSNDIIYNEYEIMLNFKKLPNNIKELHLENVNINVKKKNMFNNLPNTLKIFKLKIISNCNTNDNNEDDIIKQFYKYSPQSIISLKFKVKYYDSKKCYTHSFRQLKNSYKMNNITKKLYDLYYEIIINNIRQINKDDLCELYRFENKRKKQYKKNYL